MAEYGPLAGCKPPIPLKLEPLKWAEVYARVYDPEYLTFIPAPDHLDPELGDCWIDSRNGGHKYSQIVVNKTRYLTHRLSYYLDRELKSLTTKAQVNHHCDRSRCINPKHLYLGDQQENADDALTRGRTNGGSPYRIYSPIQVIIIRAIFATRNYTREDLAKLLHVSTARFTEWLQGLNHQRKITKEQSRAIRRKYRTGKYTIRQLAQEYQVSASGIRGHVHNRVKF